MNTYLTIMVTILVATQIIRITQNHISLFRQEKKINETVEWIQKNDVSERYFEIQRKVFYMLHDKLSKDMGEKQVKGEEHEKTD